MQGFPFSPKIISKFNVILIKFPIELMKMEHTNDMKCIKSVLIS